MCCLFTRENDVFDVGAMAVDCGGGAGSIRGVFVAFGGVGAREAEGLGSSGVVVMWRGAGAFVGGGHGVGYGERGEDCGCDEWWWPLCFHWMGGPVCSSLCSFLNTSHDAV